MEEIVLTYQEKLRLIKKTKENYVKDYIRCSLNNPFGFSTCSMPAGMCTCFYWACKECGYPFDETNLYICNLIPEWDRKFAYQVSPLNFVSSDDYQYLSMGFWYPVWDKAWRVNYLNWLIDRYTKLSTIIY